MSRPANRIQFGADTIDAALARHGITNQQAWEGIGVGQSTWFRWKKRGVPVERLTDVVLYLKLEQPAELPDDVPTFAWTLLSELERQSEVIALLTSRLDRLEQQQDD